MKLEVIVNFGGVETGEKRILPGLYEHDDPRLFGQAKTLIDMGHAKVIANNGKVVKDKEAASMLIDFALSNKNVGVNVENVESEVTVDLDETEQNVELPPVDAPALTSIHHMGLNTKVLKLLHDAGIQTKEELDAMSDDELMQINGIGHQTVQQIRTGKSD